MIGWVVIWMPVPDAFTWLWCELHKECLFRLRGLHTVSWSRIKNPWPVCHNVMIFYGRWWPRSQGLNNSKELNLPFVGRPCRAEDGRYCWKSTVHTKRHRGIVWFRRGEFTSIGFLPVNYERVVTFRYKHWISCHWSTTFGLANGSPLIKSAKDIWYYPRQLMTLLDSFCSSPADRVAAHFAKKPATRRPRARSGHIYGKTNKNRQVHRIYSVVRIFHYNQICRPEQVGLSWFESLWIPVCAGMTGRTQGSHDYWLLCEILHIFDE